MLNQMIYAGQKVQGLESGFNVINPATEAVLTVCKSATIAQVNDAVESAKQAFQTWKNTSDAEVTEILNRIAADIQAG